MSSNKSYGNKLESMNNEIKDKIASLEIRLRNSKDSKCKIYLYKDLISNEDNKYPIGVNISKRETYLSDIEFEEIFKMTKDEFMNLKKWKQDKLKKSNSLF